jgi:hypothetical protein
VNSPGQIHNSIVTVCFVVAELRLPRQQEPASFDN